MTQEDEIKVYLSNDSGLDLLKTIDKLNPMDLPTNKLCTIKDVSVAMNKPLRETWQLINEAYNCGLVTFYNGLLSRKRVDLTDIGEMISECTTPVDIKFALAEIKKREMEEMKYE